MYVPCDAAEQCPMPRRCEYYSPKISRFLVSVLYHEARSRRMPMTDLTEALLTKSLEGSESWRTAEASFVSESPPAYRAGKCRGPQSSAISSAASSGVNSGSPPRLTPARAASRASPAPSSPTKASKGATLHRLPGNQNSPTLKEFHRA